MDFDDFSLWVNNNFVAIFFFLVFFLGGLIWLIKYGLDRRNADLRNLRNAWKALTVNATKLTDRLTMRVCPIGGDEFDLKGSWYLVDSFTEHQQAKVLDAQGKVTKETVKIASKTETAVVLDKKRRQICGARYTDLKPNSSFLAETGYLALSEFDPSRSKMVLYGIIGVLCVLELILWWMILVQIEPTFLVEQPMWGIYGMIFLSLGFTVYLVRAIFGFYTLARSVQQTDEMVTFSTKNDQDLSLAYTVHQVETHWFPGCRIENTLGLDTEQLATKLNNDNQRMIGKLSSRLQTLQARLNFALADVNEKALELDEMDTFLQEAEARGYLKGREDAHVPFHDKDRRQFNINANETLRTLMPVLLGLMIIGGGILLGKFLADSVHLDSLQTTILLLGFVFIGIAVILFGLRAAMESTRSPTFK